MTDKPLQPENQPPSKPPKRRPPPLPRKPSFQPAPELNDPQPSNNADGGAPADITPELIDSNGDWRAQIEQAETPPKKILTPAEMYENAKNRPAGQKIRRPYADRTRPKRIPSEIADKEANISEEQKKKKRTRANHRQRTEIYSPS